MSKMRVRKLAKELKAKGYTHKGISEKLAEKGYLGRAGNPYSPSSISAMIGRKTRKDKGTKRLPIPRGARLMSTINAVKTVLNLEDVEASERVALALLILEK